MSMNKVYKRSWVYQVACVLSGLACYIGNFYIDMLIFLGGKSAIIAAVVLGLGGTDAMLKRADSVKEYVKTGNASAEISITFGNTGPEAYQPKRYGKELTIERTIKAVGGGGYKIKDDKGKIYFYY